MPDYYEDDDGNLSCCDCGHNAFFCTCYDDAQETEEIDEDE